MDLSSLRNVSSAPPAITKTRRLIRTNSSTAMSSGAFLKLTIGMVLGLAGFIVLVNITFDIYGLFRNVAGRELPVYHNERVSKYLLSYRYIPKNYNTIIIGTSLSANLDLSPYLKATPRIAYNASVMGANVSELTPILKKCLEGGVKNVILCVSPYMIKNAGEKEVELNKKLYYSAFASKNLLETYTVAGLRYFNVLPRKYPRGQIDKNGVNRFESLFAGAPVERKIDLVLEKERNKDFAFDEKAMEELHQLFRLLDDNKVHYLIYFHPVPSKFYDGKRTHYRSFEGKVRALLSDSSRLVNFNSSEYSWFTGNNKNYIDHGHLSPQGASTLSKKLSDQLLEEKGSYSNHRMVTRQSLVPEN
jgi:hypothetical protein